VQEAPTIRKAVKVALEQGRARGGHGAIEATRVSVIPYTPIRYRAASAAGILTFPALPAPLWNSAVAMHSLLTRTLFNRS
jgi:hypothetical protein